jgi:hypothetical protein
MTELERSNIHDWLKAHTEYVPDKYTHRYFWEKYSDHQLYAIYRDFLERGYSREGHVVTTKKGSSVDKSFVQLIMEHQESTGDMYYSYSDLDNMTFERLRNICYELHLIPDRRKKVVREEVAPSQTISQARECLRGADVELSSALYDDTHEEFLTLDEVVDMYGVGITDESVDTIEQSGVHLLDSDDGKLPYNARREELKEKLMNFIIMNKVKDHRGNKFTRRQLERLDISDLVIIYESFRSKLSDEMQKLYPSSDQLESDVRFGR